MEHEILFRGKRRSNGKWVEGFYLEHFGVSGKKESFIYHSFGDVEYNVIPETVGRYTGLTDKNGKKIFEGDIRPLAKFKIYSLGTLNFCFFLSAKAYFARGLL